MLKPAHVTFAAATAVYLQRPSLLYKDCATKGVSNLVKVSSNGTSGGVETFAVQIAKFFWGEVTGMCSTQNLDMMRRIGADYVLDYMSEGFTNKGRFTQAATKHPATYPSLCSPMTWEGIATSFRKASRFGIVPHDQA